jgi:GTPase SAR1 family protein
LTDVGGQKNERKKWISCFRGVSILIYVASLSDYDQKCYEDNEQNRMKESMEVFDSTINGEWFKDTPIILILNKKDILEKKILERDDLKVTFPSYEGGKSVSNAIEFISKKFLEKDKKKEMDRISIHVLKATDVQNVESFFKEIKETLISWVSNKN